MLSLPHAMWGDILHNIWSKITSASYFVKNNIIQISFLTGFALIVGFLQKLGIWSWLLVWLGKVLSFTSIFLVYQWNAPIWIWVMLLSIQIYLIYSTMRNKWFIGKVAGEFHDEFKNGLANWEFTGDWEIDEEDGKKLLSVANSDAGGFTKKGFTWSDYEFSFETEIVTIASGWVIRANRDNFFMVQLYLGETPKLRPHYHVREGTTLIWHPDDAHTVDLSNVNLKNEIGLLQWVKVKIKVESNQVDVYLDGVHALHYIMSRLGTNIQRAFSFTENNVVHNGIINETVIIDNYDMGRVGFRSAPDEHAHFRNVRVKPL